MRANAIGSLIRRLCCTHTPVRWATQQLDHVPRWHLQFWSQACSTELLYLESWGSHIINPGVRQSGILWEGALEGEPNTTPQRQEYLTPQITHELKEQPGVAWLWLEIVGNGWNRWCWEVCRGVGPNCLIPMCSGKGCPGYLKDLSTIYRGWNIFESPASVEMPCPWAWGSGVRHLSLPDHPPSE